MFYFWAHLGFMSQTETLWSSWVLIPI